VTVVDTKNPGWGQPLLDKIKELTNKPVTLIINTHTHGDHVSGNVEFPTSVDVVTHENTAANMKRMAPVTGLAQPATPPPNIFTQNNGRGMPKRTFKDRMSIGSGADQIDLYYFGIGHTNGDAWVVFPALRVMHAGDMFPGKSLPNIDLINGGSGLEWGNTLARVHAGVRNVDTVITGHSTMMTMDDLKLHSDFLRDLATAVRDARKSGRTVDEVASTWKIPAKYAGYPTPRAEQLRTPVQFMYEELK
jgi:glyoxylase-like metal-dependent hydrolase (beta-lactamase superfamily II)